MAAITGKPIFCFHLGLKVLEVVFVTEKEAQIFDLRLRGPQPLDFHEPMGLVIESLDSGESSLNGWVVLVFCNTKSEKGWEEKRSKKESVKTWGVKGHAQRGNSVEGALNVSPRGRGRKGFPEKGKKKKKKKGFEAF